jgi:hypothetical protein
MTPGEIWIIGTEPPCPRCDYLTRMVKDIVAASGVPATVRHLSYTSEEARRFASSLGLEPGTAKDVARKAGVDVDWEKIHALIDENDRESTCCATAANQWSPALDEALRPCECLAHNAGILMTPAVVAGGRLIHQGSVPDRQKVKGWIQAYLGNGTDLRQRQHIVEVLGPSCEKCNRLYDNVVQAVAQSDNDDRLSVRRRTDIAYFREMGVLITPGLVIDGIVVSKGKVLTAKQVADRLSKHLSVCECQTAATLDGSNESL